MDPPLYERTFYFLSLSFFRVFRPSLGPSGRSFFHLDVSRDGGTRRVAQVGPLVSLSVRHRLSRSTARVTGVGDRTPPVFETGEGNAKKARRAH